MEVVEELFGGFEVERKELGGIRGVHFFNAVAAFVQA